MASLRLSLLGSLRVMVGDAPATFESDKARSLLAYLAVESDQPHRREALVGLLWPDSPEAVARRNLRQTLYAVRQAIGDHTAQPPYLLISRDEIQFNTASDYSLDVATFDAQLAACDKHPHQRPEACPTCAERLRQAVERYQGDFLAHFSLNDSAEFEEWALLERESLHRRALGAFTQLADYHEQRGEYVEASRYALRQLDLDPWREEAHRQVMRVLAASGQRSAALAQYEKCRLALTAELGVEPSSETRALYERISHGEFSASGSDGGAAESGHRPHLPVPLTPFVGRERELAELAQLLGDSECRLLTLVGPGGIGKTRLALQLAIRHADRFAHGAAFVSLASLDSPPLMDSAVAEAIGLAFAGPTDPKLQLIHYLRGRQMLLVLDNMEHLLDGVGLFTEILEQAPEIKLIVTSREQLNLHGEWLFDVGGLELPTDERRASIERSSAVMLFLQRARRAQVGFSLQDEEKATVARICRLIGGMPLAIELAATWVRTLALDEIEREIGRSLDFLATSMRDLPARHHSMRAVFDHSWRLLSLQEQAILARLSVFRGGMQREAAEAIAGASLPLLSSLLTKSLLRRTSGGRYDLHELVRQYAADRLHENLAEEAATRNQHSDYYTNFAALQQKRLRGPHQLEALAEMSIEMENIRLGWRHAVRHRHSEAIRKPIRALWSLHEMRGWFQEGHALFGWASDELQQVRDVAAQSDTSDTVVLEAVRGKLGWFAVRLGRREEARTLLEHSAATLRSLGAKLELMQTLHHLGVLDWQAGDAVRARAVFMEELDLATHIGDEWEMALACGNLGIAAQTLGEQREALDRFQTALTAYRSLKEPRMVSVGLFYLGALESELGMYDAAHASLREGIAQSRLVGDPWVLGMALGALGTVAQAQGEFAEAVGLFRESLALFTQLGERWSTIDTLNQLGSALLASNHDAEAHATFSEALKLATEIELLPGVLNALVGLAQWQMKQGEIHSPLVLLSHVLSHPSSGRSLKDRVEQLRMKAVHQIPQARIDAAEQQARSEPFEAAVRAVQSPHQAFS